MLKANKHTPADLKQMQSLPLEAKIAMTQRRIQDWYDHWNGEVCVSFSGGKDSTVLKHIVDGLYSDVTAVFINTGLEYPELQRFVQEVKDGKYDCFNRDVEILRPKMRFDEVLKKHGYPVVGKRQAEVIELGRKNLEQKKFSVRLRSLGITKDEADAMGLAMPPDELLERYEKAVKGSKFIMPQHRYLLDAPFPISAKCCDVMKKQPAFEYHERTGKKPILGTMATESMNRASSWFKSGCNAFEGKHPSSQPMSFWTEQDVLRYIKVFDVPYCSAYGEIRAKRREETLHGQINMIDCVGDYTDEDELETTGAKRTGCVYCLFGCHLEAQPNRIQRLKQTHPRQYGYCINGGEYVDGMWQPSKEGLGLKHVMEYIGIPYE